MKPQLNSFQIIQYAKDKIKQKNILMNKKNNYYYNFYLIIIILLFAFFLYYRYKNKQILKMEKNNKNKHFSQQLLDYYNQIEEEKINKILNSKITNIKQNNKNKQQIHNEYFMDNPNLVSIIN